MARDLAPGATVTLEFTVTNTGDISGTQDITLEASNGTTQTVDQVSGLTVDSGITSSPLTLAWDIPTDQAKGDYELCVNTNDGSECNQYTLRDPTAFELFAISGSNSDIVTLYDYDTFDEVGVITQTTSTFGIDFANQSDLIGVADGTADEALIVDTNNTSTVATLDDPTSTTYQAIFSDDDSIIAVSQFSQTVYVYDATDYTLIETLTVPTSSAPDLEFNNNSTLLAIASISADEVQIVQTSDWSLVDTITDPNDTLRNIAFSDDGALLGITSDDGNIYIVETDNFTVTETINVGYSEAAGLDFSDKLGVLAISNEAQSDNLEIYNTSDWSRAELLSLNFTPTSLEFSINSEYLLVSGTGNAVIDTSDWTVEETINMGDGTSGTYDGVSWKPR